MPWYSWSQTASSNATADSTINFAEGQAPSSVNDSARALMAASAKFRDDISGAITTGGSATAYTVTSNSVFDSLAHLNGQMIAFVPHATNTNAVGVDVTLNVDGLGAKQIRMQQFVALPNGTLVLGTPYVAVYNSSDAVFYLRNMTNPYSIPLAGGMDFWGATAPNSSFAFPIGQALSRTTYATLFNIMSTTYGVGDGSTTFNLPDKTGRASAMKEASATRLTSTYFVGNSTTLGSVGGGESTALSATNQLPQFTPAGTVTNGSITQMSINTGSAAGGGSSIVTGGFSTGGSFTTAGNGLSFTQGSSTFSGTAVGSASPSSFRTCQPTIICNYIIRII